MPNLDGAGPTGQGPMTGRGMGNCAGAKPAQGRGMGCGRGMRTCQLSLEEQEKLLTQRLDTIRKSKNQE